MDLLSVLLQAQAAMDVSGWFKAIVFAVWLIAVVAVIRLILYVAWKR